MPNHHKNTIKSIFDKDFDSEHICHIILDSLPIGVIAFDDELKIIGANPPAERYLAIGNCEYIASVLNDGTDNRVWGDWKVRLRECIAGNKKSNMEVVNFTANGQNRLLHITCTPVAKLKEGQQSCGGILTIEDVTEKINAQKQLDNTEKFAAVGKLAGKIAHELNNPMDGILRYINMTMRIAEQENLQKPTQYLTQCRVGLMRMVQIISELLEFSRTTYNAFGQMRITELLEDALSLMEHKINAGSFKIERHYNENMPKIRCPNLHQVFCNLIKNSLDAMESGGTLSISTGIDGENNIYIEFSDTGTGINPSYTDKLFEPFFTTKKHGKGTGLGLAICKDIVERYGGKITAANNAGGGSKFTVILPIDGIKS